MSIYKHLLQPLLFQLDAETAHNTALQLMKTLEFAPKLLDVVTPMFEVNDERLRVNVKSLSCRNPVGLAAGFDKNVELLNILPAFGFGFVEVGTITPLKQEGHKRPRLFRYKNDKALLNKMGFNNPGIKAAAEHLKSRWDSSKRCALGINLGKGRDTQLDEALDDYATSMEHVIEHGDYFVLNVSSPNTPQLRSLQQATRLSDIVKKIVARVKEWSSARGEASKPVFVKVSPDCTEQQLEEIAQLAIDHSIGLVATNTTIDYSVLRDGATNLEGGVSGAPIREKSDNVIRKLYSATKGVVPIIGVGGIFSAEDAYRKIRLGASLVQVYSGWIYEGPGLVPRINKGLLKLMEKDGFKKIQDAVGTLS